MLTRGPTVLHQAILDLLSHQILPYLLVIFKIRYIKLVPVCRLFEMHRTADTQVNVIKDHPCNLTYEFLGCVLVENSTGRLGSGIENQ